MEKKIMRIKKWSIVPGPIHQNNSLFSQGDAAEKRPISLCMII